MRPTVTRLRIRWLAALILIAIALGACTSPAGTTAPGNGASPAPAAPTSGGYSY